MRVTAWMAAFMPGAPPPLVDVTPVRLSPRPRWYDQATTSGKPMTRIGTLQGTYLGIYQAKFCEY